jgi:hypothetical protein
VPNPFEERPMPTTEISDWGDALFLALSNALNTVLAAIPQVIGAVLSIIIGWIVARALARLTTELLRRAGADRLFAEHGGEVYGARRQPRWTEGPYGPEWLTEAEA